MVNKNYLFLLVILPVLIFFISGGSIIEAFGALIIGGATVLLATKFSLKNLLGKNETKK